MQNVASVEGTFPTNPECFVCINNDHYFLQILLSNRYKGDIGNDCLLSIDYVDKKIREPWPYQRRWSDRWFSHKFNGAGLKYEIALGIISGDICWVNGPFLCSKNDYDVFSAWPGPTLLNELDEGERVETHNGYKRGDPSFVKSKSGWMHRPQLAKMRNTVRARHETVNGRMAKWGCLSKVWHHHRNKHQVAFFAVAVITQLEIENGEPLFSVAYYNDHELV